MWSRSRWLRSCGGEDPQGQLAGSDPGSYHSPFQSGRGATASWTTLLPWQAPQPTPLRDPAAVCSICAVKDLEPCSAYEPMKMLLIDYPPAGRLLGADGAMKSGTWEPRAISKCQREGQVGHWGQRSGGRGRIRGGGEGPEFLISSQGRPSFWSLRFPVSKSRQAVSPGLRAPLKGRAALLWRGLPPGTLSSFLVRGIPSSVEKSRRILPWEKPICLGKTALLGLRTAQAHSTIQTSLSPQGPAGLPSYHIRAGISRAVAPTPAPAKAGFVLSFLGWGSGEG